MANRPCGHKHRRITRHLTIFVTALTFLFFAYLDLCRAAKSAPNTHYHQYSSASAYLRVLGYVIAFSPCRRSSTRTCKYPSTRGRLATITKYHKHSLFRVARFSNGEDWQILQSNWSRFVCGAYFLCGGTYSARTWRRWKRQ